MRDIRDQRRSATRERATLASSAYHNNYVSDVMQVMSAVVCAGVMPFSLNAGILGGFSAVLPSSTTWVSASSAFVLSIFFSAVAPWHILHLVLYIAPVSSSFARAGTEISNAAATNGIPIKAAAIFFIIACPS